MARALPVAVLAAASILAVGRAEAQSLGTFRWQLQPFCNVVSVNVVQAGAIYTVDGVDDQCRGTQRAPLVGLATPNPDGSIGFGLHVVTVPGGRGVDIDARISLATLSGSWSDSAGNAGTLAFNASAGGTARPLPPASPIPAAFALLSDGGFLAQGTTTGTIPTQGAGTQMMWHPGKASFRAGVVFSTQWDDFNVGVGSAGFGLDTRASGEEATALGRSTTASGSVSTAMGQGTTASGSRSTAMGNGTTASGESSTSIGESTTASGGGGSPAMGLRTTASGESSTAIGAFSVAGGSASFAAGSGAEAFGDGSVALGSNARTTSTGHGAFVFADRSTTTSFVVGLNEFAVRAAGAVAFHTDSTNTSGQRLAAGGSQWLGVSDVNTKHDFRALDGDEVLAKIAAMPVTEWSYKQPATTRHIGPTAQDFHAAFGLGEDPLRIGSMDADGVALAAVKALEARTSTLRAECDALREAVAVLRAELAALKAVR